MSTSSIRVIIESILKDEGFKSALKSMQETDKAARKAHKSVSDLSKVAQQGMGVLGGLFAVGAVRSYVDEFARFERKLNAIDLLMSNLGINAPGAISKIRESLEELATSGGAKVDESSDAFLKFLGITGDVEAAMFATKLASSIAEGGVVSMTEATQKMESIYAGKLRSALEGLHLNLTLTGDKATDQKTVIEALVTQYGNWGDEIQDTTGKIGSLEARWAEVRRKLGEFASKVVGPITTAFDYVIKFIEGAGAYAGIWIDKQIVTFEGFSDVLANIFDFTALMKGKDVYFEGIAQSMERLVQQRAANNQALAEEYLRVWGDTAKKVDKIEEEAAAKRGKDTFLSGAAGHTTVEDEPDTKAAEARAKAEEKARLDLLAARAKAEKDGSWERYQADLAVLRAKQEAELRSTELTETAKRDIESRHLLEKQGLLNDYMQGQLDAVAAAAAEADATERERLEALAEYERTLKEETLEEQIDALEEWNDEWLALTLERLKEEQKAEEEHVKALGGDVEKVRKKYEAKETKAEQQHTDARTALRRQELSDTADTVATVGELVGTIGTAIFGNNKAIAIASTLINTSAAIMKTYAQLGWPAALPGIAMIAAQGIAQVAQIKKTEPEGKGFDDPVNDAYAREFGGRRWARDLVEQVGRGFRAELARQTIRVPDSLLTPQVVTSAPSTSNSTSVNARGGDVNLNGAALMDRRGLRRLSRQIRRADRLDQQSRYLR